MIYNVKQRIDDPTANNQNVPDTHLVRTLRLLCVVFTFSLSNKPDYLCSRVCCFFSITELFQNIAIFPLFLADLGIKNFN